MPEDHRVLIHLMLRHFTHSQTGLDGARRKVRTIVGEYPGSQHLLHTLISTKYNVSLK